MFVKKVVLKCVCSCLWKVIFSYNALPETHLQSSCWKEGRREGRKGRQKLASVCVCSLSLQLKDGQESGLSPNLKWHDVVMRQGYEMDLPFEKIFFNMKEKKTFCLCVSLKAGVKDCSCFWETKQKTSQSKSTTYPWRAGFSVSMI